MKLQKDPGLPGTYRFINTLRNEPALSQKKKNTTTNKQKQKAENFLRRNMAFAI